MTDCNRLVWITGAYGFIGRHLANYLAQQGHTVIGIGNGSWPEKQHKSRGVSFWLEGEINTVNLNALKEQFGSPDKVFHLAGGASVGESIQEPFRDFHRTASTGIELLDWLRLNATETSIIVVSSAAVYGAGHEGQIPASSNLTPFSPYGYHKMMLEALCQSYGASYGLRSIIVRLFSVYGSGLHKQLLWDICQRLEKKEEVLELGGNGDELRDWTEISDVVRLLDSVASMASDSAPVVNGGTGKGTSIKRIAELLVEAWGSKTPVTFSGQCRPGDPKNLIAEPTVIHNIPFDWQVGIEQGIFNYVAWYKEEMNERS